MVDKKAPEGETAEAFTPEQESRLRDILAEVVGGKPGDGDGEGKKPPASTMTDEAWSRLTERQQQGEVRRMVEDALSSIKTAADVDDLKDKVGKLTPQSETPPTVLSRLGRFLWGTGE